MIAIYPKTADPETPDKGANQEGGRFVRRPGGLSALKADMGDTSRNLVTRVPRVACPPAVRLGQP